MGSGMKFLIFHIFYGWEGIFFLGKKGDFGSLDTLDVWDETEIIKVQFCLPHSLKNFRAPLSDSWIHGNYFPPFPEIIFPEIIPSPKNISQIQNLGSFGIRNFWFFPKIWDPGCPRDRSLEIPHKIPVFFSWISRKNSSPQRMLGTK